MLILQKAACYFYSLTQNRRKEKNIESREAMVCSQYAHTHTERVGPLPASLFGILARHFEESDDFIKQMGFAANEIVKRRGALGFSEMPNLRANSPR